MYRVNVVDVRTGQVVRTKATASLKNLKHTIQDCGITSKGASKTDPGLVTYIMDEDWTPQQVADIQKATRKYESPLDIRDYGLEFYLFFNLYMTEYERTQLYQAGQKSAFNQEEKLQASLTAEDSSLAEAFEIIRAHGVPVTVGFFGDIFTTPKYHRIRA